MSQNTNRKPTARQAAWQGMNWIRQEKRLAIYLRDGLSCVYCGASIEDGAQLSLDHLTTDSRGGSNDATNLVTCCSRCNSSRADRPVRRFARSVAGYLNHGITAAQIISHVENCRRRVLPLDEAKTLIARRGSVAGVLAAGRK